MKVFVYMDVGFNYRWNIRASNGKLVACSGESFFDKATARRSAKSFIRSIIKANFNNKIVFVED